MILTVEWDIFMKGIDSKIIFVETKIEFMNSKIIAKSLK